MRYNFSLQQRGLSIVEVIVVSGIVAIFFSGLLASFYYTISLVQDSKVRQSALSVAYNQIEYIRSLAYDAVGTVSGIPAGLIPQVATSTLNNISFTTKTLIEYVDDPIDGEGLADANGVTTDYKTAKVTVSWDWRGLPQEVFLLSRVIPRSIETDVGGGTIRVNVFDAEIQPLPNATVRLVNNSMMPIIDVTRETNSDGVALFGGAPAGADYEVTVTDVGYSVDSTYPITAELVNPTTPPAAVAEADITTLNFFIDEVGTMNIKTISPTTYESEIETFATTTGIVSSTGVSVVSGILKLEGGSGAYVSSGEAQLQTVAPADIDSWGVITITGEISTTTTRTVQVYTASSTPILIPDTDLPGNSSGFTTDTINISGLSIMAYSAITLGLVLTTNDIAVTPTVDEIEVSYLASASALPNTSLEIIGSKIIGTRGDATLVYKFSQSLATDGLGEITLADVEWDTYTITPTGYTITEACIEHPVTIDPAEVVDLQLILVPEVVNALRVVVVDAWGVAADGVEITLSRTGYSDTKESSPCGQVSFLSIGAHEDYVLTASVNGVEVWSQTEFLIAGNDTTMIQLP